MSRSSKKSLSASGFREVTAEFDSAREVVWLNVRRDLSRILADETRPFQDRLLDVLADVKAAALLASTRTDPLLADLDDPPLKDTVAVLAAPRLGPGATGHRPRLGPGLVGRGWHQPEPIGQGTFGRWSGPGSLSSIFVPHLASGDYWVEGYLRFLMEGAEEAFQMRLGQEFVTPRLVRQAAGWSFRARLSIEHEARSSFSKLEFYCGVTGRPRDLGAEDDRTLGFFLSRIEIIKA